MLSKNWKYRAVLLTSLFLLSITSLYVLTNIKTHAQTQSVPSQCHDSQNCLGYEPSQQNRNSTQTVGESTLNHLTNNQLIMCRIPVLKALLNWKCPGSVEVNVPVYVPIERVTKTQVNPQVQRRENR